MRPLQPEMLPDLGGEADRTLAAQITSLMVRAACCGSISQRGVNQQT